MVLEVLDKPRAIELAAAEIAGRPRSASFLQANRPKTALDSAADARPIGQRRAGNNKRTNSSGRSEARIITAHRPGSCRSRRLAIGIGMQSGNFLDESPSALATSSIVWPGIGSGRKPMK